MPHLSLNLCLCLSSLLIQTVYSADYLMEKKRNETDIGKSFSVVSKLLWFHPAAAEFAELSVLCNVLFFFLSLSLPVPKMYAV